MTKSMEPNQEARKEMMACARSKKNPNNSFFIDRETGELKTTSYRDDKGYFPNRPKNTYEVHILKEPFFSYEMLQEQIDSIMQRVWEEDEMEEQQEKEMRELASYSDEVLKGNFGFSDSRIAELREYAEGRA
jgi:hypothetical protein